MTMTMMKTTNYLSVVLMQFYSSLHHLSEEGFWVTVGFGMAQFYQRFSQLGSGGFYSPKRRQDRLSRLVFTRWGKGWDSRSRWCVEISDDRLQNLIQLSKKTSLAIWKVVYATIAGTIGPGQVPEEKIHHQWKCLNSRVAHFHYGLGLTQASSRIH